jgi:hypothetical protein
VFQSERRLAQSISIAGTTNVTSEEVAVNSTNVGPSLTKETIIPQATSYTITGRLLHTDFTSGTVYLTTIPFLYFTDSNLNVEDLETSEAYLLRVVFTEDGSILRINGLIESDLYGNANEAIDFADLAIPVRTLEWISGSGECILLVID